jgi:hypothetical protein
MPFSLDNINLCQIDFRRIRGLALGHLKLG